LLKSTHRRNLPYTSSDKEDTWDALSDLDAGTESGTVRLIYAETEAVAEDSGEDGRSWNREHLWPKSHGVGYTGADFTDIHHLRPSDTNVNSARGNKYFSNCGVVADLDECRSPAHQEAAATTATDSQVWLPPESVRGDIARSLFYMEYRYCGEDGDPDLELTDCPTSVSDTKLAYRSQLLQWHIEDPVDEAERARNHRACERWQGNRNIFVDFPELVSSLYGEAQSQSGSNGYLCPDVDISRAPTNGPISDDSICKSLKAGDVQVVGLHSDSPDEVALVALEDLPYGLELFLTDNGWTGSSFRGSEGTAKLLVPSGGISKGAIFGFGPESSLAYANAWSKSGNLALSATGDSVIVYCKLPDSSYNFLAALTYDGSWVDGEIDSNSSVLPPGLGNANTALSHKDNYKYIGPRKGSKNDLIKYIAKSANWSGFNSVQSFSFGQFSVSSSSANLKNYFLLPAICVFTIILANNYLQI